MSNDDLGIGGSVHHFSSGHFRASLGDFGGGGLSFGGNVPGHEFLNAAERVISDAAQSAA